MVGSIRSGRVALSSLAMVVGLGLSVPPGGIADDKPAGQSETAGAVLARKAIPSRPRRLRLQPLASSR